MVAPAWSVTTAPTSEPLTLDEVRAFLRIGHTYEDTLLSTLIAVAREVAENETRRALITQTITLKLPSWRDPIRLPMPKLQSVTSVVYKDQNGASQTWASANYVANTDGEPGEIWPLATTTFPTLDDDTPLPITVVYVAGYGAASAVPEPIKQGMKLFVHDMWMNRGSMLQGSIQSPYPAPNSARYLWRSYEVAAYGMERF